MKHLLMIVANKDFQDLEFSNPYQLFLEKKYAVDFCSGKGGACVWVFGTHLPTSLSFDEVRAEHYDALVFVGGGGAYEEYVHDERYITLGKKAKLLCAICIAPTLLAPSGRLKGKEVTGRDDGNGTEIKYLEAHGAKFIGGEVVRDEEVITANGPQASVAFGWKIIEALEQTTTYH